jgi:thymidylate synthase
MLNDIIKFGEDRKDRTGTGTKSLFGYQAEFNLQNGFPLLTTKKLHWKSIVYELLWMLSGNTNVNYLKENGVNIWNEWADENGNLGPIYGQQWRDLLKGGDCNEERVDQIKNLIHGIRNDPYSRRHIVSAWNPTQLEHMRLHPCHAMFQMYVHNDGRLDCHMYQRSADVFLGVPFNIASYALLTHIIASITHYVPGKLIISYGDLHLYNNHIDQAHEQLERTPKSLPHLMIVNNMNTRRLTYNNKQEDIVGFNPEDFIITNYDPHPHIKAEVSK